MKTTLAAMIALALLATAGLGQDASPLQIQPTDGGALAAVDVLAASDSVSSDGWTGIHPVVFLRKNWKGIAATAGSALAAYAAYEIYDNNNGSSKKSKDSEEEDADPDLEIPDISGGVVVTAVSGVGNQVTTYFYSPQN